MLVLQRRLWSANTSDHMRIYKIDTRRWMVQLDGGGEGKDERRKVMGSRIYQWNRLKIFVKLLMNKGGKRWGRKEDSMKKARKCNV